MSTREKVLSKISAFPTLPVMASRLLNLLDDQDSGISQIAEVIKYDPALTVNVLKAANSSYLGFSREVSSMTEAAVRLGTNWIFKIAISSLINSSVKKPAEGYDLSAEDLWKHSMVTALTAENLCKMLKIKDKGQIFTAAILHDMGKIVLGEFIADSFISILRISEDDQIPFEEAEKKFIEIDHAEIGGLIAQRWNFPPQIVECIRFHHNPDAAADVTPAIDIVHIADALCLMADIGAGRAGLRHHPSENSIKRLQITSSILELAVSQIPAALESIDDIFKEMPVEQLAGRG